MALEEQDVNIIEPSLIHFLYTATMGHRHQTHMMVDAARNNKTNLLDTPSSHIQYLAVYKMDTKQKTLAGTGYYTVQDVAFKFF